MTGLARVKRQALWGLGLALGCSLVGCGGSSARGSDVDTTGTGGSEPEPCKLHPLSAICPSSAQCPTAPDDVPLVCNSTYQETTSAATECGGTVVHVNYGLGGAFWYFDDSGKLVGVRSVSDTGPRCGDSVGVTTYGEICSAIGQEEDRCLAACTNQAPLLEDGAMLTEENYDFDGLCAEETTWQVTQAATVCGGKLYEVSRSDGSFERYCFDDAARLIGRSYQGSQGGKPPDVVGATCQPGGPEQPLCAKQVQ